MSAFLAFLGVLLAGVSNFDWKYTGDLILSLTSLVQGFMLIFMSQFGSQLLGFLFYGIYVFMFHSVLTVLSAKIGETIGKTNGCFGIVFSVFALLGSLLSVVMVGVVNEEFGFEISNIQDQFMIYGFYHFVVCVSFIAVGLTYWFAKTTYQ